jgi:hypothetical protein
MKYNLTKGLTRLWLISVVVWIVSAGWLLRPDLWTGTLWEMRDAAHLDRAALENKKKAVEAEIRQFEASTASGGIDFVLLDLRRALGSPLSAAETDAEAKWEKLNSEKGDLERLARRADSFARARGALINFALVSLGPPGLAFMIGASLIWAFRGFRG